MQEGLSLRSEEDREAITPEGTTKKELEEAVVEEALLGTLVSLGGGRRSRASLKELLQNIDFI